MIKRLRSVKDTLKFISEKYNTNISSYKLIQCAVSNNIKLLKYNKNYYFYLDDIENYYQQKGKGEE